VSVVDRFVLVHFVHLIDIRYLGSLHFRWTPPPAWGIDRVTQKSVGDIVRRFACEKHTTPRFKP
jgi:hypothetical protein